MATVRALKMHGGLDKAALGSENLAAVEAGCANLERHIENVTAFGVPVVVAVNRFLSDTEAELVAVRAAAKSFGAKAVAEQVLALIDAGVADFKPLYEDSLPLWDKVELIATKLYGTSRVTADDRVRKTFEDLQDPYGHFTVCMAKTQYSLSTDPNLKGAPTGHVVPVREVRVSGGAGFLVVVTGAIMTMPGLPRVPAANSIALNDRGQIEGLF